MIRVVQLLESALFPGYREERAGGACALDTHVTERLDEAYDILYRQVLRALPFRRWRLRARRARGRRGAWPARSERMAEEIVGAFFTALPRVRELAEERRGGGVRRRSRPRRATRR